MAAAPPPPCAELRIELPPPASWERGARHLELFLCGPFDDRPSNTPRDAAQACAQLRVGDAAATHRARGVAGRFEGAGAGAGTTPPGAFALRLRVTAASSAPAVEVALQWDEPQPPTALGVDLYVTEALEAEGGGSRDPRTAVRRRATATLFLADLAGAGSTPLWDYAPVHDPEDPAKRSAETQTWGAVRWTPLEPATATAAGTVAAAEAVAAAERDFEATAKTWYAQLANADECAKYERAAGRAGLDAECTVNHLLSPFNYAARLTSACAGTALVYGLGTPARFRAETRWLRHQLEEAFAREARSAGALRFVHADAVLLASACAAWLAAHPYLEDRDAAADGTLVPGDAYYNPFLQDSGDCEDVNAQACGVWRAFALRGPTAEAEEADAAWRGILDSAAELARAFVPFVCTGAARGAYASAKELVGPGAELATHMYGLVLPMHVVEELVSGVGGGVYDPAKLKDLAARTRDGQLQPLVLECTGWVSPHGGPLELAAARERAESSVALRAVVPGVPDYVRVCVRHSFCGDTRVRGGGTARPSRRMHMMVTTLMTDQLLRMGALANQGVNDGPAWLGFRLSPDGGRETWSVDTAALFDKDKRGALRLYPVFCVLQQHMRACLAAERPPPLMRFSEQRQRERDAATRALIAALAGRGAWPNRPPRDAAMHLAASAGAFTPLLVDEAAAAATTADGKALVAALAARLRELKVAAVTPGPGVARCLTLILWHA